MINDFRIEELENTIADLSLNKSSDKVRIIAEIMKFTLDNKSLKFPSLIKSSHSMPNTR